MAAVSAMAISTAAFTAPAAPADAEPNGAVFMAEGPIAGGQEIRGTLDGADRDDWYVFHVEGVHQLHLTGGQTLPGETPANQTGPFAQPLSVAACATVELTDADGKPIPRDFTSRDGQSTFYVHASLPPFGACSTTPYGFRIDPAEGVVTGPGKLAIRGTGEPNDSRASAGGPLTAGAWYHSGSSRPRTTATGCASTCGRDDTGSRCRRWCMEPTAPATGWSCRSSRGADLGGYVGSGATISSFGQRVRGAGARLYIAIRSGAASSSSVCVRSATVVRVGPEEAIMSAAEVREACAGGRTAKGRASRAVNAARRALARARAHGRATGAPRRRLQRNRAALRRASAGVSAYCSR